MCYSLWYNAPTMLPAGGRQQTHSAAYTLASAKFEVHIFKRKILLLLLLLLYLSPLCRVFTITCLK